MSPPAVEIFPKLVVFDLDGTLWYPEMYMLWGGGGPPFSKDKSTGDVKDCAGTRVYLMNDTRDVLKDLQRSSVNHHIALAISSKTDEPGWAQTCMNYIEIEPGVNLKSIFKYEQISKVSKDQHFHALHKETDIAFEDMIFFDNEPGNCRSVSRLGVHCIYVPDGFSNASWVKGIKQWRATRSSR